MRWLFIFILLHSATQDIAQVNRNDVVIDEIMADPTPVAGLPDAEFIELKNQSAKPVNLNGWKVSDATGTATISQNFILQPDSFVVICSTGSRSLLSVYGNVIGISGFPSLDNNGEVISVKSNQGKLIHAVEYSKKWYRNDLKSEGGWSLEMIDPANACSGAVNWKASTNTKGGTPGRKNSVDGIQPDHTSPVLLRSFAIDSTTISLLFDEPLDSSGAANVQKYILSDGIGIPQKAEVLSPLFTQVWLRVPALLKNKSYTVTIRQISDCSGNEIMGANTIKTGLPVTADTSDIVLNEILFNPKPDGVDYLEIYNRSMNIIDAKELYIANRSAGSNALGTLRQVSAESRLLFPDEYLVITEDAGIVQKQYAVKNQLAFAEISSMPSFPDDKGTVVLLNRTGKVIDELKYDEKWHFKLIDNNEGVTLERIDYSKPTQDAGNWHSASTSSGYGTPTYKNSQFGADPRTEGTIRITPSTVSPDNDGHDDFATVYYQFPEPGYVCNITIFNARGIPVRTLTHNALCGITGYFRWDGLGEKGNRLQMGVYVMLIDIFNLQGKIKRYKRAVTLAVKLL